MKVKTICLILLSFFIASCTKDEPSKKIIGTWSEPYHTHVMVKSIVFLDNGTCVYTDKPDTTWPVIIDYAGINVKLNYSFVKNKLCFSGEGEQYNCNVQKSKTARWVFYSDYQLEERTLTIDSFSYDGGLTTPFYKPLILEKK